MKDKNPYYTEQLLKSVNIFDFKNIFNLNIRKKDFNNFRLIFNRIYIKRKGNSPEKGLTTKETKIKYWNKIYNNPQFKQRLKVRILSRKKVPILTNFCSICNKNTKLERHHEDYNNAYEVTILCRKCHAEIHKENRNIYKELN